MNANAEPTEASTRLGCTLPLVEDLQRPSAVQFPANHDEGSRPGPLKETEANSAEDTGESLEHKNKDEKREGKKNTNQGHNKESNNGDQKRPKKK